MVSNLFEMTSVIEISESHQILLSLTFKFKSLYQCILLFTLTVLPKNLFYLDYDQIVMPAKQ